MGDKKDDKTPTEDAETTETAEAAGDTEDVEVPEDLSELGEAELEQLSREVNARGKELAAHAKEFGALPAEELAEAETLHEIAAEIDKVKEARKAEAAANVARAETALSRFAIDEMSDDSPDEGDEGEGAGEGEGEGDQGADEGEAGDDAAEDGGEGEAVTASTTAQPRKQFKGASPAFLRSQSKAPAPKPAEPETETGFQMEATAFATVPESTQFVTTKDVAQALWRKRMAFGNIPKGVSEQLSIATGTKTFDAGTPMVGMDPQTNLVALRDIQQALVASGEFCTPQTQLYNFFRLAQPIRDVEDAIPTVQAPRGGIRFIQANCTIQGAGAIGSYTYDPDTPGGPDSEDPEFEKPCDRVSCPDIGESFVEAVTKCVIFDNLQYRTFPELVEDFMEDVAIQFTMTKQKYYLDKIDAASTLTIGIGSYGAARSLVYDLTVAANGYRKRHHMPRGATLDVLMPDWSVDVIKADLFNDGDSGLDYMNVPDSAITTALRNRNLNVTFFYEDVTGDGYVNTLAIPQAGNGAALNDYPAVVSSFMFAPGTFVKLDGGTLDVGLYRDHTLNKSNDFAMFMEEWIGFVMLGCESVRIDSTVCPSGSRAPYASALRSCPSAVSS